MIGCSIYKKEKEQTGRKGRKRNKGMPGGRREIGHDDARECNQVLQQLRLRLMKLGWMCLPYVSLYMWPSFYFDPIGDGNGMGRGK